MLILNIFKAYPFGFFKSHLVYKVIYMNNKRITLRLLLNAEAYSYDISYTLGKFV